MLCMDTDRQVSPVGGFRFHDANDNDFPSNTTQTVLLSMLPKYKGDYLYNNRGESEWEIQQDKPIEFIIYGYYLDGSVLSFTTHGESCEYDRKDKRYLLTIVSDHSLQNQQKTIEQAHIVLNLPYYGSTLYMCLRGLNSKDIYHQGRCKMNDL
ncbi:unnamed protein product [Didymodactylos carnosus]|uniref:Uncharacterized protein n=1 Tax=Didymodactylos carnosus TaxID=1234261 RepID=A0A814VCF7_9BILA|nr:unnamed protein product [Didymodactylos carnosus]CAF3951373.1 unnamed protein product [Didymodactylos carnosus]